MTSHSNSLTHKSIYRDYSGIKCSSGKRLLRILRTYPKKEVCQLYLKLLVIRRHYTVVGSSQQYFIGSHVYSRPFMLICQDHHSKLVAWCQPLSFDSARCLGRCWSTCVRLDEEPHSIHGTGGGLSSILTELKVHPVSDRHLMILALSAKSELCSSWMNTNIIKNLYQFLYRL